MSTFHLEIVTPTKVVNEGDVSYVRCPALDGLFGVMAGHTAGLFALTVGEIKVTKNGEDHYFATGGGYADVTGVRVELLLETVERSREIDVDRAKAALKRAKERLSSQERTVDHVRARGSMARALNRMRVAQR